MKTADIPVPAPRVTANDVPRQAMYMRRDAASQYLAGVWGIQRKPATLAKLACVGGGPSFVKAGRFPLYRPADLDAWARDLIGDTADVVR